jgi:hypothetical protein
MPLFFTFIFLSYDTLQDLTSHNVYMMSGAAVVSHGSHHMMRLGQARFLAWNWWSLVFRLQSVAEFFGRSPQLGLEPAHHTSEALADRYLNGSQLILIIQTVTHPPA